MIKENLTKLFSFTTPYLVLLAFVIFHLVLLIFGLSFITVLWNSWFFHSLFDLLNPSLENLL